MSLQHVIPEPFESSPFIPDSSTGVFGEEFGIASSNRQLGDTEFSSSFGMNEKENSFKENNVAKIKVVVCLLP